MDTAKDSSVNDENNGNKATAHGLLNAVKSLGRLRDGPRRAVLGDVSNSVAASDSLSMMGRETEGGAFSVAGVSRNLRAKTVQASIVTRAKALGAINNHINAHCEPSIALPTTSSNDRLAKAAMPLPSADLAGKENAPPQHHHNLLQKPEWDDLDAEDAGDPLMVSEYVVEIIKYMRTIELNAMPFASYMESQKELNWNMRAILVDWLVEVQWKLKLLPETLFLSVNLIDRFLSKRAVSMVKLQLVGLTSTMIASKVEEVLSPSVANFIYLSDNAYEAQELLKAERYMLHVLNYVLAFPSPLTFLRRCSKAEAYDVRTRTLGKYFMETALLDEYFVSSPPSLLAAMSIYLARTMLNCGPWTANLRHYSGYEEAVVKLHADQLVEFLKKPLAYKSIFKKYSSKKLMKASVFVEAWIRRTYPDCPAAQAAPTVTATE